jgi:hypothetical protein
MAPSPVGQLCVVFLIAVGGQGGYPDLPSHLGERLMLRVAKACLITALNYPLSGENCSASSPVVVLGFDLTSAKGTRIIHFTLPPCLITNDHSGIQIRLY